MADEKAWTFALVDLAGFTALTEAHGDDRAADLATSFADLARSELGPGDRLVKTIGDAVLLAAKGPEEGIELVRKLLEACHQQEDFPVTRAGLHHGPAVERGDDMYGAAVNLAARVAGQAAGGQVLATEQVAEVAARQGMAVTSLGEFRLRNVSDATELFEVDLLPVPQNASIDPVCRMRVEHHVAAGRLRHEGREYWFCSLDCAQRFAASPERFLADPSA
jgi:class 3 adenylate cyclase/YHS domain-containing protein